MGIFVKHVPCPKCGSKDNCAEYDDGSMSCFTPGCGFKTLSEEYKEALEDSKAAARSNVRAKPRKEVEKMTAPASTKAALTQEENDEIKKVTSTKAKGFRGLADEITTMFGVRHSFDEKGNLIEQYYPCTQDGQLVGYKIREEPKNFYSRGRTGADVELFMQFKFNRGGKYVLVVEGELDALSAYQMLREYSKRKGYDTDIAVVSATTGAQSKKQLAAQYAFLNSFENVILCMDNDKAGQDAVEILLPILPKGKVKVMTMRYKDPNKYLENGKNTEFISDFFNAKLKVPVGVLPSDQLYDRMMQQAEVEKVKFPDFMGELNDAFPAGLPLGYIINIAADTGIGKTTLVNEMTKYWIFHSPHKIGIVTMELDAGQYGEVMLSQHIGRKLALIPTVQEKLEFLARPEIKAQADELFTKDGEPRFYVLDDRDGSIEDIQETVEELVVACGCKFIILDPLQDVLDGLTNEEQAVFMKWAKGMIKSHGITFIFINHMRKNPAGQKGQSDEQDIMGSSTIIKSAAANILLSRDKMAEDPIVRNRTDIRVSKNRIYSITGPAGSVYYDPTTHRLHNFQQWMEENGNTQA